VRLSEKSRLGKVGARPSVEFAVSPPDKKSCPEKFEVSRSNVTVPVMLVQKAGVVEALEASKWLFGTPNSRPITKIHLRISPPPEIDSRSHSAAPVESTALAGKGGWIDLGSFTKP